MIDNCTAIEPLLARAAEGSLPPAEQVRLDAHLENCASCRGAFADQRAMRELLQSHPVEGARLGFDTRVMAAIRAEAEARSGSWLGNLDFRRWTLRLVPVAAALALASFIIAAPASSVVSQPDTTSGLTGEETTVVTSNSTDDLPVSSALWSESVSGSSFLSLLLTANADDTLSKYRKDQ